MLGRSEATKTLLLAAPRSSPKMFLSIPKMLISIPTLYALMSMNEYATHTTATTHLGL